MKSTITKESLLAAIQVRPQNVSDLRRVAANPEVILRLLRELASEGLVFVRDYRGRRCWCVKGWKPEPIYHADKLKPLRLLPIIKAGPITRARLIEVTGRSRDAVNTALAKLRKAGKIKPKIILGVPHTVVADWQPSDDDVRAKLLYRSDEEGNCRVWRDATTRQGHPLMMYEGRSQRADFVAWKLAGKPALKPGQTLIPTKECGCLTCIYPHHRKPASLSASMKLAFSKRTVTLARRAALHNQRKAQGDMLTDEQVEYIRSSPLKVHELAKELGRTRFVIIDCRARKTYRDYSPNPFRDLGA